MRVFPTMLVLGMVIVISVAPAVAGPTPEVFTCPVTIPTESRPDKASDPFDEDTSLHYEDGLWVSIPENGVIELSSEDVIAFGPLEGWRSTTVTWLREDGVEGFIEVSGNRLDVESELAPRTPLSPQRQYVRVGPVTTGLAFPSGGCWEVVGSADGHQITFIVDVRFAPSPSTTPEL